MIYTYLIVIYGNEKTWVKSLLVTLINVGYWTSMMVTYECITAGGSLSMRVPMFRSVLSPYHSTAHQILLLGSTNNFLCLTNFLLKYRYVSFCCSILLYTFVVFQVEHVWRLLPTICTVKPHKPLVLLLFHCQWNHHDCTASIPMHWPFKQTH